MPTKQKKRAKRPSKFETAARAAGQRAVCDGKFTVTPALLAQEAHKLNVTTNSRALFGVFFEEAHEELLEVVKNNVKNWIFVRPLRKMQPKKKAKFIAG